MKLEICFTGQLLPKFSFRKQLLLSFSFLVYLFINPATAVLNYTRKTDTIFKALKIGDKVPDLVLPNVLNYPKQHVSMGDFKGKLIILDFWATWCSPCVAMIPKLDSLQSQFAGKIQVLPVAYQSVAEVQAFLSRFEKQHKKHFTLPDVVADKNLTLLFPHNTLPHFVWIDKDGIVQAITEFREVTAQNIALMLKGEKFHFREKVDPKAVHFDFRQSLASFKNIEEKQAGQPVSVLTPFTDGFIAEYRLGAIDSIKGRRITFININLDWIYRIAYGGGKMYLAPNRILYKTRDSSHFTSKKMGAEYHDWARENAYCYEFSVPAALNSSFFELMQKDLQKRFPQYSAEIKPLNAQCLALVRTSTTDLIGSTHDEYVFKWAPGGCVMRNQPLSKLVNYLNASYLQLNPVPLVDDTGYKETVDIELEANMSNVDSLNQALKAYDLKLIEKRLDVPMLTVNDNPKQLP
ncbi:TlpA family protein disulfide reductase [Mucilaginibacter celer]|uniref:Thioredoxin domain-containing protein n=1 Tax=Mucilaginibacter celer TaxID=2305508 RepID=A0A494VVH0_9SPHI|nr:TlpA family protein disulfide reductase [Mucilaginibacter celer]AYL95298.1 hypothetical protein HYN43_008310 [Mucilaginibacter celer]